MFYLQLDFEDSSTIFLYGGVAVVAAWLVSAVVGAIDSIPVVFFLHSNSRRIQLKLKICFFEFGKLPD